MKGRRERQSQEAQGEGAPSGPDGNYEKDGGTRFPVLNRDRGYGEKQG